MTSTCDGAITVYSVPGDGTTFHLYFPALDLETPAADVPDATLAFGHGQSILFIDDEPVLTTSSRQGLSRRRRILQKSGSSSTSRAERP